MTDAALTDAAVVAPSPRAEVLRPARQADLRLVHSRLMEVIESSPFYSAEFKAYEKARLTPGWLEALVHADPWHVALMQKDGETVGFMISGPELGTLWLYWSYLFPEQRKSGTAMASMRAFCEHWNNGRFHKIATYTKRGNDVAAAIMQRFGWTLTATLEKHIFGEDYLLYEKPLTKSVHGYDRGLASGRIARLRRTVARLLGR